VVSTFIAVANTIKRTAAVAGLFRLVISSPFGPQIINGEFGDNGYPVSKYWVDSFLNRYKEVVVV